MKELILFYLEDCPYCHNARRALKDLEQENPCFATVPIQWVEESRRPDLAEQYDYYYVPTVFCDGKKLYEAHPGESYEDCRQNLQAALETVLNER